ncbi:MAG TPA: hypothetical protein VMR73_00755 [Candidatus Paceibacterota bacterium]|nr:hypothetical protein [Candidatus Paceibacterota bacterium]
MHSTLGIIIGSIAEMLVLLGAWCAYRDDFFRPRQMKLRGTPYGLPYIAHGGMWGDIVVSLILGYVMALGASQWSIREVLVFAVLGICFGVFLHRVYAGAKMPSAHAHNGKLTHAGRIHLLYMSSAFAILGLFYFETSHIPHVPLIIISVFLAIHIVLGNNTVLRIIKPSWWYTETVQERIPGWIFVGAVWLFLAWQTIAIIKAG